MLYVEYLFIFFEFLNLFYIKKTFIIALKDKIPDPLTCNCVNCRCFYDEFGTHMKCFPGWNGTLCDINAEHARRLFHKKILSL